MLSVHVLIIIFRTLEINLGTGHVCKDKNSFILIKRKNDIIYYIVHINTYTHTHICILCHVGFWQYRSTTPNK